MLKNFPAVDKQNRILKYYVVNGCHIPVLRFIEQMSENALNQFFKENFIVIKSYVAVRYLRSLVCVSVLLSTHSFCN